MYVQCDMLYAQLGFQSQGILLFEISMCIFVHVLNHNLLLHASSVHYASHYAYLFVQNMPVLFLAVEVLLFWMGMGT